MSTGQSRRPDLDLSVQIGGIALKNPVMPASGTYDWKPGDGQPLDPNELGAIVTKSITIMAREGNPPHRVYELPGAVINSIGIPSLGFEYYREHYLIPARNLDTRLITSIAGFSASEFGRLCGLLDQEPQVDAIELNLSCPNIETDSIFATDLVSMTEIIRAARRSSTKPLIAKLSPNVSDIVPFAKAAESEGCDALCIANTFTGMAIDVERFIPIIGNVRGGVTGPGLLPIILHHVWNAAEHTNLPIIASGGIYRAHDAVQYLLAGASAVQVGTASFKDPLVMRKVLSGLIDYLVDHHFDSVSALVGRANPVLRSETLNV